MQREKLAFAQAMRRNPTRAEAVLWAQLRGKQHRGEKWRQQALVSGYIVDFYCPSRRLIVEVDGGSHIGREEQDAQRDWHLQRLGYRVVHVTNEGVLSGWLPS